MKTKKKTTTTAEQAPWRRLSLDCQMSIADTFSALLLDEGALGLETEDDETRAIPGKATVPTGRTRILATFSRAEGVEARISARLQQVGEHIKKARDINVSWSDLFAEDWNAIFMAHWRPFRLGRRVWIVPSWERDRFFIDRIGSGREPLVLHLDPGMAFGTGQHETTQLCTEALERHLDDVGSISNLLDVGTGTGILALVALRLGAVRAKGTDIDPVAVKAAIDNANDNGVGLSFVANDDLPNTQGPVFDAVIANILAGTLIEMVDQVAGAVAPGGRLWLSGILVDQAAAVIPVYEKRGLKHLGTAVKNEWVRIDFTR